MVSAEAPEKKMGKLIVEMLQLVPVIYVEGGIRFMLCDLLKNQFPQSLSSWPILKEAVRECDAMKSNFLSHLTEIHSRYFLVFQHLINCFSKHVAWIYNFAITTV